jgi:hypothetical protein
MTDERDGRVPDHRVEAALQDLREALAIEPAPDFAARVRARVAHDEPRRWPGGWRLWSLAAVGAAATIAIAIQTQSGPPANLASVEVPASVSTASQAAAVAPVPVRLAAPATPATATPRRPNRTAPGAVMTSAAAKRRLDVLVPPDQALALQRLLAAIREGRAVVPAGEPIIDETTGELILPAPLTPTPIRVDPLPGTPDEAGGRKGDR